ncbi:MAG: alcohol dehydrogenase catalytic domain-containing protein [Chloroflexi bacterium]|nr:alcohol dehydrogenase catalytic domain-containing protein [Chloroflexota bacterium]
MNVAAWTEDHHLAIESRPEAEPAPGDTLVRIDAAGICGTDLHMYRGEFKPAVGAIPGHELGGVVERGGPLPAGTPVAIEPVVGCLECGPCRGGMPHRCTALKLMGISAPGGLQQRLAVRSANVYPLPAGMSPVLGSLVEPLAVAVRGVHLAELPFGSRAIVLGAGSIGLMSLLVLRKICTEVAITARYPHQRELALQLGAAAVFEPGSRDLRTWAKAHQPDAVLETVGGEADTLTEGIFNVRAGGVVVALGVFTGRPSIPAFRLVNDEVRLIGSVMYGRAGNDSEFGAAARMSADYRDELALFQTDLFPLKRANEAFDAANDKKRNTIKVAILPNE